MQRLLAAILTAFDASATCTTAFPGGLHLTEAAPGTAMPYLLMMPFADPATWKYGGFAFSEASIQFTGRAVGANVALAAVESFMGVFDPITLTLADSKQNFHTIRPAGPIAEPADPTQDDQGRDSFGWIVVYDFATTG